MRLQFVSGTRVNVFVFTKNSATVSERERLQWCESTKAHNGKLKHALPLLETNQDRTACRRVVYACGAGMEAQPPGPLLLQVRHLGHREAAHHKTVCACLCGARRQVQARTGRRGVHGRVAAGQPLFAEENVIGEVRAEGRVASRGRCFALEVDGDSMVEAGIHEGDVVIVRQQPVAESGDIALVSSAMRRP